MLALLGVSVTSRSNKSPTYTFSFNIDASILSTKMIEGVDEDDTLSDVELLVEGITSPLEEETKLDEFDEEKSLEEDVLSALF